ncbi:very short patch repair endonuclease [Mucilaginibacter myungsuensis]|uniref:Very short patch repair endonuclease n=1 Tax=Mucilaginibacter myungsuensis TaxID=649104 RepID=A0A929PZL5_9SPHI|nr:very short patch repair endonuclease [Mucilaginibacter myungsuensis]MBE9664552.1 very short patch repair endonuclease [Mucilaginibacter myungsuensis]MDN3601098.1 very short patch repair endonuclease [Mucilaginibacter myungsuensis]
MAKSKTIAIKEYVRDKRSPVPKSATTSKVMSAIKAKNTDPEVKLRKLLWTKGLRGYRLNWKKAPGRPDIAFPGREVAVFVHGCFWHRCPICAHPLPKHNTEFWADKFGRNVARDKAKADQLTDLGWQVITVWECELKKDAEAAADNIVAKVNARQALT